MGKIIGIDLGTTNSVVAVMEGGNPTVIPKPIVSVANFVIQTLKLPINILTITANAAALGAVER